MTGKAQDRDTHAVLGLRVWLSRQPFRLAPAWAVLAGALASGEWRWQRDNGLVLLLAVVLADGLWGQLWALLVRQANGASKGTLPPLPYAAPESPASRLWHWLASDAGRGEGMPSTAVWRVLLMAVLFAFGLAALLGPAALVLTAAAWLLAGLARYLPSRCRGGALLQAGFEIGLAWLLGHLLVAGWTWSALPLLLAAGYVLLHAGSLALRGRRELWLVNMAQLVALACVIAARQPLAAGALGITLLAPLAWQPWMEEGTPPSRREGLEEGGTDDSGANSTLEAAVQDDVPGDVMSEIPPSSGTSSPGVGRGESASRSPGAWHYRRWAQVWWWVGMMIAAWAVGR